MNSYKELQPFSLKKKEKKFFFEKEISLLTLHHYKKSQQYKKILKSFNYNLKNKELDKIPFLPTRLFKEFDLTSVSKKKISKVLKSSGTTGNKPSKINLDKENARAQTLILTKIMQTILGNSRLPMLIIDQNPKIQSRSTFNARVAAIYGFSILGKDPTYLLNKKNEIDYKTLNFFLKKYANKNFFIFGFTSLVFDNLALKLSKRLIKHDFKNGILIHGGGWKKMENLKVTNKSFKDKLSQKLKIKNVYNYYGLVEQTGSIFIECKDCSSFVTSVFSDVLIRDKHLNIVKDGEKGLIQLFSLLPKSYPGHSILTEDLGKIVNNNCKCKTRGKRFVVYGRAKESEIRGCSDV
jgi:phenylacetate-coenzyme A ligase PaaK-like adenylate-forming protein